MNNRPMTPDEWAAHKAANPGRRFISLRIDLNGTDENPYHRMGLTQNPIPQLARAEWDRACLHLAKLGGDPIPDYAYIRRHLAGWEPEFVDLLCTKFRKGERVRFIVEWEDV